MRLPAVAAVALVAALPAAAHGATLGPGCAPDRPAIAHHAGAKTVAADRVPVPCTTETGFFTGETGIGVTRAGTLWFSAADWEWALARSTDLGAHWERFGVPGPQAYPGCGVGTSAVSQCDTSEQGKNNTVADAFVHVDRDTGRTFWSKTYGYAVCSSLNYGDEDGTWGAQPRAGCPGGDYEKVAAGPAPAGGAKPAGYANVVYLCTNGPAPTFVVGPARVCFKSLDGGATFSDAGVPAVPSPMAPGCLHFQEPQIVGRDGTVYLPLNCGSAGVQVAISHDEASSWTYATVPTGTAGNGAGLVGGVSAAVDDAGTLYVVWPGADDLPYLAVTRDQGKTWKGPLMVAPPGVKLADEPRPQVAARAPGHIAIGAYGYLKDPQHLNGYLTESFDASSADPTFYTATVNDPARPLYFPTEGGSLPRNDYLGVTIGPDETPWTAVLRLTSAKPDSQGFVQSTGVASRLTFAPYVSEPGNAASQAGVAAAPHSTSQAVTAAQLACTRGLVLTDVIEGRTRVHLLGVAQARFVGQRLRIVFAPTGLTVARPTVRPDGTFETTGPLPARRLRAGNAARYRAQLGRQRSPAFKLRRRLMIDDISARSGRVTITGRVLGARAAQPVVVQRRATCRRLATVGLAHPDRAGHFRVTLAAPRGESAAVYRLRTRVPRSARDRRLHATYTLTPAVDLGT